MRILINIILILFFITSCSFNKVIKKHGVRNLEKKQEKLILNTTNSNDITKLLGPPSVKSTFDNDLWIFIEREITHQKLIKLGKEKLVTNNVLILELNSMGILIQKDFYDINKMNDLNFTKMKTQQRYTKKSFIYDFLSSMRQKINDPLGKRKKP